MISIKSSKRTTPHAATIERSADLNSRFGLNFPDDKLAIVTEEVPGLTEGAILNPFDNHDLVALVQQVVIVDRQVAVHIVLDLQDPVVADYFVQGIRGGLLLVLVDSQSGVARALTIKKSNSPQPGENEMRAWFAEHQGGPSQAAAYVATVAYLGFQGGTELLRQFASELNVNQFFFRPVLSNDHRPFMPASLEELIANGQRAPIIRSSLGKRFVAAGTKGQLMAYVDSIGRRKH